MPSNTFEYMVESIKENKCGIVKYTPVEGEERITTEAELWKYALSRGKTYTKSVVFSVYAIMFIPSVQNAINTGGINLERFLLRHFSEWLKIGENAFHKDLRVSDFVEKEKIEQAEAVYAELHSKRQAARVSNDPNFEEIDRMRTEALKRVVELKMQFPSTLDIDLVCGHFLQYHLGCFARVSTLDMKDYIMECFIKSTQSEEIQNHVETLMEFDIKHPVARAVDLFRNAFETKSVEELEHHYQTIMSWMEVARNDNPGLSAIKDEEWNSYRGLIDETYAQTHNQFLSER